MTKSNLQENIKNIVLKLKLIAQVSSDTKLADILGTDKHNFSNWKNKSKTIPIENLIKFCDTYKVTLDSILRDKSVEKKLKDDEVKMPYYGNYNFVTNNAFIVTKKSSNKKKKQNYDNVRAVKTPSNEMPRTAPRDSIMFLDFNDDKVKSTPSIFLIQANENYFLREVSITPQLNYFLDCENDKIQSMTVEKHEILILAKLIGVTKWQN